MITFRPNNFAQKLIKGGRPPSANKKKPKITLSLKDLPDFGSNIKAVKLEESE